MKFFISAIIFALYAVNPTISDQTTDDAALPSADPLENLKDTQKYISDSIEDKDNLDSYLFAYNRAKAIGHEKALTHKRVKRTEPQFIKFELSDAKEPDEMTKKFLKRVRQQRQLEFETLKVEPKVDRSDEVLTEPRATRKSGDQIIDESEAIQIYTPNGQQVVNMRLMPIPVRKAIESIVQKRSLYENPPAKRYAASLDIANTGNSIAPLYGDIPYNFDNTLYKGNINLDFANQIPYIPALFPSHNLVTIPEPIITPVALPLSDPKHQVQPAKEKPKLKYVHFAKPLLRPAPAKFEASSSPSQPHNNVNINLPPGEKKIEINFDNIGVDILKNGVDETGPAEEKLIAYPKFAIPGNAEAMSKALTDLISKTPTEQLKELRQLLTNKPVAQKLQLNAEENTAPILFPPVKPANSSPKAVGGSFEDNFEHLAPVTDAPRDYTPITEQLDDVTPEPFAHYIPIKTHSIAFGPTTPATPLLLPTPTSFKEVNLDLSPNYHAVEFTQHDSRKLQYASKYNFGYRIRDFHTGNDFGHTEKRDDDGVTRGQYHILLPDGRVQNVEYHVDDTGYHADVTYQSVH
ncbi:uncharacterized protein LOC119655069 [Hermetia illucens]|uniref:uncharacterized protein LOC119655069 n=1 Tax=Hermetia illucens TaxID=343691 RepID=UPI0018CC6113|nr:uncharacterized protein LOC119655069 [Hermetia illucens]